MEVEVKLPAHFSVGVAEISPHGTEYDGPTFFFTLLDELKEELGNTEFLKYRRDILEAYSSRRLYGLFAGYDDAIVTLADFEWVMDTIGCKYLDKKGFRILPCFIVLNESLDKYEGGCEFIWTAKRSRNKNLARVLLNFFNVNSVENTFPEPAGFWSKYFKSVTRDKSLW
jgi:hypothetical protein